MSLRHAPGKQPGRRMYEYTVCTWCLALTTRDVYVCLDVCYSRALVSLA